MGQCALGVCVLVWHGVEWIAESAVPYSYLSSTMIPKKIKEKDLNIMTDSTLSAQVNTKYSATTAVQFKWKQVKPNTALRNEQKAGFNLTSGQNSMCTATDIIFIKTCTNSSNDAQIDTAHKTDGTRRCHIIGSMGSCQMYDDHLFRQNQLL